MTGCLKLDNLPENLWNVVSLEELDLSGIALRKPPLSIVCLRNPNPVSLLLPYLPNLCSLTRLNLSNCDLHTIPNDIGCLASLEHLNL